MLSYLLGFWSCFSFYDEFFRSQSILQFTPTMKHIGKVLVCKASNSQVPGKDIQDDWHLNISCEFFFTKKSEFVTGYFGSIVDVSY